MGSHPDHDPEPSTARAVAAELGSAARHAAATVVEDTISTISMLVLLVLLVPVGIVGLVVSFLLLALITKTVGLPSGMLGSIFGIAWLVGTVLGLVVVFRKLYRRMPRRLRSAYAAPMQDEAPEPAPSASASLAGPAMATVAAAAPAPTLAELDARLAQDPGPPTSS